jgi:hypothetical protein
MPLHCCVPRCRSNYDKNDHVTVFRFPMNEELKARWLRSIHRQDYIVNKNSRVCIKHFPENFIIREDKAVKTDGTVLVVPRQRLKLPDDAYATIFLDQPSYMTKILPAKRKNPETCLDKLDELLKDKSWKRIASILRPIATHHDHIVNKAHRLAMMMNYDAVAEQNSRLFLVHSQSKIDFYQIEILENDCNCRTMKYPICDTCVHKLKCSCYEATIKNNFCKHMHLVIMYIFKK